MTHVNAARPTYDPYHCMGLDVYAHVAGHWTGSRAWGCKRAKLEQVGPVRVRLMIHFKLARVRLVYILSLVECSSLARFEFRMFEFGS